MIEKLKYKWRLLSNKISTFLFGKYFVHTIVVPLDWIDSDGNPIQIDCLMYEVTKNGSSACSFFTVSSADEYVLNSKEIDKIIKDAQINDN